MLNDYMTYSPTLQEIHALTSPARRFPLSHEAKSEAATVSAKLATFRTHNPRHDPINPAHLP